MANRLPFYVDGEDTAKPIELAHRERLRTRRPVLVCFRKWTDDGNPYVVPAFWVDKVRKCDCGVLHYHVTSQGHEYLVTPEGNNSGSCFA